MRNFFVGAGFNAFGIASAGGAGWVLAQWVSAGEQPLDLWVVDIRRFSDLHRDRDWTSDRTLEAYGKHYTVAFPLEEYESGRPRIVSPLYERLKARGAVLRLEARLGARQLVRAGRRRAARRLFVRPAATGSRRSAKSTAPRARRSRSSTNRPSPSSRCSGKDAERALSWIAANDVSQAAGPARPTRRLLNSRGGIECDLTVARLAEDRFYIVTGTGFRTHDLAWIGRTFRPGSMRAIADVTEELGHAVADGAAARDVLAAVTEADVSNAAFPFGQCARSTIAGTPVRALRVTYVGELGWELHMPIGDTGEVFDALMAAGAAFGIRPAGYRAIESLRLEKGYRAWGADITPNDNPFQAGLGWAVKLKSGSPFLGREATEKIAGEPLTKRLATFTVDDPALLLAGRETILRDGKVVGYLTSGGWGYTVGKAIGLGYVRNAAGVSDGFPRGRDLRTGGRDGQNPGDASHGSAL